MLSATISTPRRPRPRRSITATPPPPYASSSFSFPSRHLGRPVEPSSGLPMSRLANPIGSDTSDPVPEHSNSEATDLRLNEKSRDELTHLLMKADELIHERENELSLTTAVCKTLYENNISLKSKHQALLARIPTTPLRSVSTSPVLGASPLPTTPHYYDSNLSSDGILQSTSPFPSSSPSPSSSVYHSQSPLPSVLRMSHPHMHTRKISMTSADIAQLSDQNAELLQKLEALESESAMADQAGRRALRRLEREISVLRADLERTQARSEELEEKAIQERQLRASRRRKKRASQASISLPKPGQSDRDADGEYSIGPRNFAPPRELVGLRASIRLPPNAPSSPDDVDSASQSLWDEQGEGSDGETEANDSSQPISTSPEFADPALSSLSQPENALISQLLGKITELEETNAHIIEQQSETARKLLDVQRETENMSLMYECLGDQNGNGGEACIELEIIDSNKTSTAVSPTTPSSVGRIIRFGSLRRRLENAQSETSLRNETDQHTITSASSGGRIGPQHRVRRSVVGFFDLEDLTSSSRASPHSAPDSRLGSSLPSPTLSSLSINSRRSDVLFGEPEMMSTPPPHMRARTLENELAQDGITDVWGTLAANEAHSHHFRTSSLYDMSFSSSVPASPSSPPEFNPFSNADVGLAPDGTVLAGLSDLSTDHHRSRSARSLDTDPGTPTPVPKDLPADLSPMLPTANAEEEGPSEFLAGLSPGQGKHSLRYKRMSRTVRARTSQWADGRFKETLAGLVTPPSKHDDGQRSVRRKKSTIAMALDVVMDAFAGKTGAATSRSQGGEDNLHRRSASSTSSAPSDSLATARVASPTPGYSNAVELHYDQDDSMHAPAGPDGKPDRDASRQQGGVGKLLLEVWLWLQFAVIIIVFLWAMARRGPKSVLFEAEKRRDAARR